MDLVAYCMTRHGQVVQPFVAHLLDFLPLAGDGFASATVGFTGAAPSAGNAVATYDIGAGPKTVSVAVLAGDSADAVATKLVAGTWPAALVAVRGPSALVLTPSVGVTLKALSVALV